MTKAKNAPAEEAKQPEEKIVYRKHKEYGHVYGIKIGSPNGQLVWPYFVKPKPVTDKQGNPKDPRFEGGLIMDKSDPKVQAFVEKLQTMSDGMLEVFNEGKSAKLSIGDVLKDGDKFSHEKYPYYKGKWLLEGRKTQYTDPKTGVKSPAPLFWDIPKGKGIMPDEKEASFFKGGMIVKYIITPLITANGISYQLSDVQYIRDDGERIGGTNAQGVSILAEEDDSEASVVDSEDSGTTTEEEMSLSDAAAML